jgi:hypothetical protein
MGSTAAVGSASAAVTAIESDNLTGKMGANLYRYLQIIIIFGASKVCSKVTRRETMQMC